MSDRYRVLVTGSRDWSDKAALYAVLDEILAEHPSLVIVNGQCPRGADAMAVSWVMDRWTFARADVTHEDHPADWSKGKGAGFARNAEMVKLGADACLAFIKNRSRGASHCADLAEKALIPTRRYTSDG